MRLRSLSVIILCLLNFSFFGCKKLAQGQLGSTDFEGEAGVVAGGSGAIRAILGQLDFETASPLPGSSLGTMGVPAISVSESGAQSATVRMQFSVNFDVPVSSLEEVAQKGGDYTRVGTLTTFDINHEPATSRLVSEQIGRPVYLVPVSACAGSCLRFVTGGGTVKDRSQIIILEFHGQGGSWTLKWFSYFGKEVKEFGMPAQLIRLDSLDGAS